MRQQVNYHMLQQTSSKFGLRNRQVNVSHRSLSDVGLDASLPLDFWRAAKSNDMQKVGLPPSKWSRLTSQTYSAIRHASADTNWFEHFTSAGPSFGPSLPKSAVRRDGDSIYFTTIFTSLTIETFPSEAYQTSLTTALTRAGRLYAR